MGFEVGADAGRATRFAMELGRFGNRAAIILEDGPVISYAELAARVALLRERLGATKRLLLIEARNAVEPLAA